MREKAMVIASMDSESVLDRPIPIAGVPAELQRLGFRRPHIATVYRWLASSKLDSFSVGGTRYTTRRMLAQMRVSTTSEVVEPKSPRTQEAESYLQKEGI